MPENSGQAWRRWFGLLFLALGFGMLVWGQTVLQSRLEGIGYLVYWSFCFLFTLLSMATALLDILLVRRKSRKERRELLRKTLLEGEPGHEANVEETGDRRRPT